MAKNTNLIDDYYSSLGAMESVHSSLDDKEKIILSQPLGKITEEEAKSKVTDPTLLSAVLKQNNSVMAQMPTGKVTALTKENRGKSLFMDVIFRNYVLPNATSQCDVFTKLWMLSFYRKVYGSMGVLIDFVSGGAYGQKNAGPDFTLLPLRAIIPQIGRYTVDSCDHLYVRSRLGKEWLKSKKKDDKWKNIDKVLDKKADFTLEFNASSYVERKNEGAMVKRDEYEIVTKYEGDKWTTFHPTTGEVLRETDNLQNNDKIPVIMCHAYPLLDRFIGLGDFERGMNLHSSMGSLISLYMDGAKAGIFPNLKIDPQAVENWSEIKQYGLGPGQIWLMKPNSFNGVEQMTVKPDLATFQSTYQFLKASILTLTNTTDTSVNSSTDPGFGKTPQALKMQAFSQGMQTQFDRRMLEISTEKIFDRMINLIAKKQGKSMNLYLKQKDLEAVKEIAPDVVQMFEVGGMGQVTIKHTEVSDVEYRYEIDQGSTVKKDEMLENESLKDLTGFVLKNIPSAAQALATDGMVPLGTKKFDLGEAFKRITISSGITDPDKIIVDNVSSEQNKDNQTNGNVAPADGGNALNMEDTNTASAVSQAFTPPQQGQSPSEFSDPAVAKLFEELQGMATGGKTV